MAEKKSEAVKETKKPEMVKIKLPRPENGESDTQFVGVNGKAYLIEKGKEVEVPLAVYEVLKQSEAAKDNSFDYLEKL